MSRLAATRAAQPRRTRQAPPAAPKAPRTAAMITIQPIATIGYTRTKPIETITTVTISITPIRHPHPQPSSTARLYPEGASVHSLMPHLLIVVRDRVVLASTTSVARTRSSSSFETSGTAAISPTR